MDTKVKKVRATEDLGASLTKGKVYEVLRASNDYYTVCLDTRHAGAMYKTRFEVVLEETPELKVGDRVVRGPTWDYDEQDGGGPGTVTEETDGNGWVRVWWDNGHRNGYKVTGTRADIVLLDEHSAKPEDPSQSQKADAGKSDPLLLEVDLVDALSVVNRVLDYGKAKYGTRAGWKGVDTERYDSAARRHRIARDHGELFDPESGLAHLAHEATNLLFQLQTFIKENPATDFMTFSEPPQDHRESPHI